MTSPGQHDLPGDSPNDLILDVQGALERIGGDRKLLRELASIFAEDGPPLLNSLAASILQGDCSAAQHFAHGLKGMAANVGGVRLELLCYQLETATRNGELPATTADIDRLRAELTRLISALQMTVLGGAT